MKHLWLIALSCGLFFGCNSNETPEPDPIIPNPPACSPTEIIDNINNQTYKYNLEYDTQGRITKQTAVITDPTSAACGTTVSTLTWGNGQYTVHRIFTPCAGNVNPATDQILDPVNFELYPDGNLKKLYATNNSYRVFTYNAEGYLIKTDSYDANNVKTGYIESEYVNGNRITDTYYLRHPVTGEYVIGQNTTVHMKYNENQLDTFTGMPRSFCNVPMFGTIYRPAQGGCLFKIGKRNKHVLKEVTFGETGVDYHYRFEYEITDGKLVKYKYYNITNSLILTIDYPLAKYICQ